MPLDLVKLKRFMRGRSQSEIARDAGMAHAQLWRILAGRQANITIDTVDRLAKAVGCKPTDIIK